MQGILDYCEATKAQKRQSQAIGVAASNWKEKKAKKHFEVLMLQERELDDTTSSSSDIRTPQRRSKPSLAGNQTMDKNVTEMLSKSFIEIF